MMSTLNRSLRVQLDWRDAGSISGLATAVVSRPHAGDDDIHRRKDGIGIGRVEIFRSGSLHVFEV
jgi:hypothetical protein